LRWFLEPVLQEQIEVVALVEDSTTDVGIERAQTPDLAVLLGDQLLIQRGYLDVEIELGEIEVGGEALGDGPRAVPGDVERRRLVAPLDLIEVEQAGELALAVVREAGRLVWLRRRLR
jgi:hypothetical protein